MKIGLVILIVLVAVGAVVAALEQRQGSPVTAQLEERGRWQLWVGGDVMGTPMNNALPDDFSSQWACEQMISRIEAEIDWNSTARRQYAGTRFKCVRGKVSAPIPVSAPRPKEPASTDSSSPVDSEPIEGTVLERMNDAVGAPHGVGFSRCVSDPVAAVTRC